MGVGSVGGDVLIRTFCVGPFTFPLNVVLFPTPTSSAINILCLTNRNVSTGRVFIVNL